MKYRAKLDFISVPGVYREIKLTHKWEVIDSVKTETLRKQYIIYSKILIISIVAPYVFYNKFHCEILLGSETGCPFSSDLNPEFSFIPIYFPSSIVLLSPTNDLINGKSSLVSDHYTPQLLSQNHWRHSYCAIGKSTFAGVIMVNRKDNLSFVIKLTFLISISDCTLSHHSMLIFIKRTFPKLRICSSI